ncbi:glycoside hydrolase family 15 protein [Streptomyces sp. NPDC004732]|uniref:glycoside hydrolase family 15 protein n=1 Tax=Streptomyces sp. NPDC004732 TaxID=3154290 RepID=UPI0033AB9978
MSLIEDHILVGDLQTACLIDRTGTAAWLCLPTFESPAVFTSLLGTQKHGAWQIAPQDQDAVPERRYRGDSLIAETTWALPHGAVRVLDFMPPHPTGTPGQPQLIRIVQGIRGRVRMASTLRLRFSYGQVVPRRDRVRQAFGETRGVAVAGPDAVWLDSAVETTDRPDGSTIADFTVRAGESVAFALTWRESHLPAPPCPDPDQALAATTGFWEDWIDRCTYLGSYREAVIRSLITLKASIYAPTGGIVAAPTTSLPEWLGGNRNWDYRYTWLRDSAITLSSFLRTGYREEASAWREWLLRAAAGDPERLQIMYSITGRRELTESVLNLPGFEGSKPVRIGNAAATQRQLDVYGEVIETLHLAHESGLDHDDDAYQLQVDLLNYLAAHWREPDKGLWEVRGPDRHFVHSKIMAWVAVDRMIQHAESRGDTAPLPRWRRLRTTIHKEVCEHGYDPERNTFTQSYGSSELDASLLLIPQTGFLPPTDRRVIGTIEAVQRELSTEHGLVLRYPTAGAEAGVDGLTGDEGAFLACSFWLVEALTMIGRREEARDLFEQLLALRNDVGLLAEEYDPVGGRQLGNFPQAFSHFALIGAALRLVSPASDNPRDGAVALDDAGSATRTEEPALAGRAQ